MNVNQTLKQPSPASDEHRNGSALMHMPAIDGVRGIAILLVLIHHFTPMVSGTYYTRRMLEAAHTGWIGVDLFFVLSGFLITAILLKTRKGEDYFLNFYARRTLRIFPVYYLVLTVLLLALPAMMQVPAIAQFLGYYFDKVVRDLPAMIDGQSWLWLYGSNVKIALTGERWGAVNHFWSLAVEEHFYLVWPLVIWFVSSRENLIKVCLVCILGAPILRGMLMLAGFDSVVPYVLTPCRVDSLAFGALLSILIMDPSAIGRWVMRFRILALGAATGLVVLVAHYGRFNRDDLLTTVFGYSLLAIVSTWVVLAASQLKSGSLVGRLVANPVFASLGKYSYGLYVTHMFFAPLYIKLFGWPELTKLTGSYPAAIVIHATLAIVCSWAIAWVCYHTMEKHFLRLKSFFDYRRAPQPAVRPATVPTPAPAPAAPMPARAIVISPRQAMRTAA